ncbi:hypothetical protein ACFE04_013662 [Oxalis oulophora]
MNAITKNVYRVKLKPCKLERVYMVDEDRKSMQVKIKWIGDHNSSLIKLPYKKTCYTSKSVLASSNNNNSYDYFVQWDDEFEKVCDFSIGKDGCFRSWDVSFDVFYGGGLDSIGRVLMNLAELLDSRIGDSSIMVERKLPIFVQIGGVSCEASLLVQVNFMEVRSSSDDHNVMEEAIQSSSRSENRNGFSKMVKRFMMKKKKIKEINKNEEVVTSSSDSDESLLFDSSGNSPSTSGSEETSSGTESASSPETRLDPVNKSKMFSWRLSFRRKSRTKSSINPRDMETKELDNLFTNAAAPTHLSCNDRETKELVSRDRKAKLKSDVFFASFDQRSTEASGESACTAIVTEISHWLHSNMNSIPTRAEFDSLITEGCSTWRKLCENDEYTNSFPDKHFDLETVLEADLRPICVSREQSFTGFFSPENFESLKEAMSFDQIWSSVCENNMDNYETRIYIVSWNDHFFVLKAEADAFYIIDSLGERLFEGCNQAYILKFDESSVMYEKVEEKEEIICRGKECCREYIKRFLAGISIAELEEEEQKKTVSTFSLIRRLQIDFNLCIHDQL